MEVSLDGKVALVTGAGPNIGSGIALVLAAYGAKVACNDTVKRVTEITDGALAIDAGRRGSGRGSRARHHQPERLTSC